MDRPLQCLYYASHSEKQQLITDLSLFSSLMRKKQKREMFQRYVLLPMLNFMLSNAKYLFSESLHGEVHVTT